MDELDPGAKRKLLGDLRQLQSLLQDDDGQDAEGVADDQDQDQDQDEGETEGEGTGALHAPEPPLLEDFVDPVPADFDPAAFEDTDWNQFVDQVFAQTSGIAHGLVAPSPGNAGASASSTPARTAGEHELMAELTRRLDARLAALRASMLAELEAMIERRGRLR
jgi:hypothetical protein